MKEGRKCGRGEGGTGREGAGGEGRPSQRWLLAPALRPANCGLPACSSCWGWRSAAAARPWQGGGEPGAGGNCIPGHGAGDLQLGGTGNECGLLTGRLQTPGTEGLSEGWLINLSALFSGGNVNLDVLGQQCPSGTQLASVGSVLEGVVYIVLPNFLCEKYRRPRGKKNLRNS